jgi:hypothetical protein
MLQQLDSWDSYNPGAITARRRPSNPLDDAWNATPDPQFHAPTQGRAQHAPMVGNRAAQVIDTLGVAQPRTPPPSGPTPGGTMDDTWGYTPPPADEPQNTGVTGGTDYSGQVQQVTTASSAQAQAVAKDRLARTVARDLKAAGHDVEWNGDQLIVDGRPYDLAGSGSNVGYRTDWGGGNYAQQQHQIEDAIHAGAPLGFDQAKWADPTHDSDKYTIGRMLAAGASIDDVAHVLGWEKVSADTLRAPDGSEFDVLYDVGGPNQRPQMLQTKGAGGAPLPPGGGAGPGGTGGGSPLDSAWNSGTLKDLWSQLQALGGNVNYSPTSNPGVEAAFAKLMANPESMDPHTVQMMQAQDAEEQMVAAQSADEEARRFGFQAGITDSPWLASERASTARNANNQIISGRRNIEMKAKETNLNDLRQAVSLGMNKVQLDNQLQLEAARLGLSKQELAQQLLLRLRELEQNDRQFGADLGYKYDELNSNNLNHYWDDVGG